MWNIGWICWQLNKKLIFPGFILFQRWLTTRIRRIFDKMENFEARKDEKRKNYSGKYLKIGRIQGSGFNFIILSPFSRQSGFPYIQIEDPSLSLSSNVAILWKQSKIPLNFSRNELIGFYVRNQNLVS